MIFGLGGIVTTLLVVPLLRCLPGKERRKVRWVRLWFHHLFRIYIKMMRLLGLLRFQIENTGQLANAKLVLANHPSLLDVVFLISLLPNACCIVKGRLIRNLFVRGAVRAAGYIFNESPTGLIEEAASALQNGDTLIIFPEGTRSTPSGALKFKRGAANIAIRTGFDITPVLIYCKPPTLTKNDLWYDIPPRRPQFRILVRDTIPISYYTTIGGPAKGARQLTDNLVEYFDKELKAHERITP